MDASPDRALILMRSKLFVPGSRPELFHKALASQADAISVDLEDAVQEARKGEARALVGQFLEQNGASVTAKTVVVRVNAMASLHFEADVRAVAWSGLDVLNLPKVESAGEIKAASAMLADLERERGLPYRIGILANIESPKGLRRAADIAAADPRIIGLQLGFGDLFEPLGIDRQDVMAVRQIQLAVRLAAGEAGVDAYDGAFAAITDAQGFRTEAEHASRLGFRGKSCIHPSQVTAANQAFCPKADEIAFASRVITAWNETEQSGRGAIMVEGRMIDLPFAERAQAVLAMARRLGLSA